MYALYLSVSATALLAAVLAPFVIRPNWHWLACNRACALAAKRKKEGAHPEIYGIVFGIIVTSVTTMMISQQLTVQCPFAVL